MTRYSVAIAYRAKHPRFVNQPLKRVTYLISAMDAEDALVVARRHWRWDDDTINLPEDRIVSAIATSNLTLL